VISPVVDAPVVLKASNVDKWFGRNQVLHSVSLAVASHGTTAIIGPSGSGKTTFLRCLNGLERPEQGRIEVAGRVVPWCPEGRVRNRHRQEAAEIRMRQEFGFVFQRFNLWPHMTALENVIEAPIRVKKMARDEATTLGMELLTRVGLQAKWNEYPRRLSGGQQQRVAIARALAMRPSILLFDEATSALDPEMVREVLDVMRELAREGMTMICVTHEMGFAREVARSILMMDEGRIVEEGPPEQVLGYPICERTARFLSKVL
jgi:polar amino acid transport system ATP-binding protein